jgi:hypothetical protein
MSIYDQDYSQIAEQLTPPDKRNPNILGVLRAWLASIQWLRDLFFDSYVSGSAAPLYSGLAAYVIGNRVRYSNNSIYECILATTGNNPTNETYWIKVQDVWMGRDERVQYTGQKLSLEYFLNKWFGTNFIQPVLSPLSANSDIYLTEATERFGFLEFTTAPLSSDEFTTSHSVVDFEYTIYSIYTYDFTVNVPLAVFNALGPDDGTRTAIIRQQVSKYSIFPSIYNIVTY